MVKQWNGISEMEMMVMMVMMMVMVVMMVREWKEM